MAVNPLDLAKFKRDELVWVTWEGYDQPWPSIVAIEEEKYHVGRVGIFSFGTGEFHWVRKELIERHPLQPIPRATRGQGKMRRAVDEMEAVLERRRNQVEEARNVEFSRDELVWIEWIGYPLWPSYIAIEENSYNSGMVGIYSFGTGDFYYVPKENITRNSEEFQPMPEPKGSEDFVRALNEFGFRLYGSAEARALEKLMEYYDLQ